MEKIKLIAAAWLLLLAVACQEAADKPELLLHAQQIQASQHELDCSLQQIQTAASMLWDSVAQALDQRLPESMPPEERHNMLKVRNTPLIQMFMAYDSLDLPLQQMVEKAGEKDAEFAKRILENRAAHKQLERQLDSTLQLLQKEMPEKAPQLIQALQQNSPAAC